MLTITLIEAPTSAGAYAPGQEDGARALLDAGLREGLEAVGVTVRIGGQASPFRWRPDPENPRDARHRELISKRAHPPRALPDGRSPGCSARLPRLGAGLLR